MRSGLGLYDVPAEGSWLRLLPFGPRSQVYVTAEQLRFLVKCEAKRDVFTVIDAHVPGEGALILVQRESTGERCALSRACFRYATPLEMLATAAE